MKTALARNRFPWRAFTLIEIMIVVAIIGLIAAMGVPAVFQTMRREGMRKAVNDVMDLCGNARARAIFQGRTTAIVFHPAEKRLEIADDGDAVPPPLAGTAADQSEPAPRSELPAARNSVVLPANVDIAMLDINMLDFSGAETARVHFFPNGTSEELTLVLHCRDEWDKITLEFSTALASVGPVNR